MPTRSLLTRLLESRLRLGETYLERKCRFIFGGGIVVLVTCSFYWYSQKTESLVIGRTSEMARMLVDPSLMAFHAKMMGDRHSASNGHARFSDLAWSDDVPGFEAKMIKPLPDKNPPRGLAPASSNPAARPSVEKKTALDPFEKDTLARFLKAASLEHAGGNPGRPKRYGRFRDGTPDFASRILPGQKEYQYVQAVFFRPGCLAECHGGADARDPIARPDEPARAKAGDLAGAVSIRLRMDETNRAINRNRATMITAALVTAIVAMVGSYLAIRYVVIRPLEAPSYATAN